MSVKSQSSKFEKTKLWFVTPDYIVLKTPDSSAMILVTPASVYTINVRNNRYFIETPSINAVERALNQGFYKAYKVHSEVVERVPINVSNGVEVLDVLKEFIPEDLAKNIIDIVVSESQSASISTISYSYTDINVRPRDRQGSRLYLEIEHKLGTPAIHAKARKLEIKLNNVQSVKKIFTKLFMESNEKASIVKEQIGYVGTNNGVVLYIKTAIEAPEELAIIPKPKSVLMEELPELITGRAIAVKGFLVEAKLPSRNLLNTYLPEIFKNQRIGRKEIWLAMGYFLNQFGVLSRKFYEICKDYAIDTGFGYVVPHDKVYDFLREIDKLKQRYRIFEKWLKDFLLYGTIPPEVEANKRAKVYPEYRKLIMEYLEKQGKLEEVKKKIESLSIADRVRIWLIPFSIDMSILEEYVDEKVKKRVEEELYAVRKELAESIKRDLEEKAREIIAKLESYATTAITPARLRRLREEFREIEKRAIELGIKSEILEQLGTLLSMDEKELAEKLVVAKASGRVKALLQEMLAEAKEAETEEEEEGEEI